jgi:hypothetical protein
MEGGTIMGQGFLQGQKGGGLKEASGTAVPSSETYSWTNVEGGTKVCRSLTVNVGFIPKFFIAYSRLTTTFLGVIYSSYMDFSQDLANSKITLADGWGTLLYIDSTASPVVIDTTIVLPFDSGSPHTVYWQAFG